MILNEEQSFIRETARKVARERLAPTAAIRDRDCRFPAGELAELGRLGFMGMVVPRAWGGAETDYVSYVAAIMEIAAGDGPISTIMGEHTSVCCLPVLTYGTEEQKNRFLRPMARGEMIGCFCLTEPEAGSDPASIKTIARKDGRSGYVISGTKQFITSGRNGSVGIVFAVTDPNAGKKGISAFVVPTNTPGWTVTRVEEKMGQRSSDTCALSFDDMWVPADSLLGREGEGLRVALSHLDGGRLGIAAQSVGMGRAAFEHALGYAKERRQFGKLLIEHQAVAFRLADMATRLEAAEQLVLHVAAMRDAGLPCFKEASMAKVLASETAERVCSDAIQTLGGYGYLADFPLERIYRDVRVCQIYEGTGDMQRLVIARALTG
ncbi:acyl-CoA dehydrogenase family protein [Thauera chlorobenzoica]|uniref:3-sulfinopropanoyl-CoA desulfinase n=1 Tax=Thauera chlorobenzoica TaxID=96773 RepID=A0A1L6FH09_9RHOO|nr:acyl-CoA dehydrogenase family protein [Thauera chlorobenzoica]APR06214.1 methylglutaryl-CoA dehydrogenase [Thauera chlorobenzoica]